MTTYSHSRLKAFLQCPQQFKLHYLDQVPAEPVAYYELGRRFHEAIESYVLHCYAQGVIRDYAKAQSLAARYDDPQLARIVGGLADRITLRRDLVYTEGDAIEQKFLCPLPNGDCFTGRIDLVERDPDFDGETRWIITDWKSGYSPNDAARLPRQLLLYMTAWHTLHGGRHWKAVQCYPATDLQPLEWVPVLADLKWDWVVDLIARINAETVWEARPSQKNCQGCGWVFACEEMLHSTYDILTADNAQQAAMECLIAGECASRIRSDLRDYTQEHGPIILPSGETLGWFTEPGQGYTLAAGNRGRAGREARVSLVEDCLRNGLDPADLIDASPDALTKFFNGRLPAEGDGPLLDGLSEEERESYTALSKYVTPREQEAKFDIRKVAADGKAEQHPAPE